MKHVLDNSIDQLIGATTVSGLYILERSQLDADMHQYIDWDRYVLVVDEACPSHPFESMEVSADDSSVARWICIHADRWEEWIVSDEARSLLPFYGRGNIRVDRDGLLASWQERLIQEEKTPNQMQYMKTYALFLEAYNQAKHLRKLEYMLDAYRCVDFAFYYWASLAIIEQGEMPRQALWQQVKKLNLGVYKMYEEFTASSETMPQRIELALLACEFSLSSKSVECCAPLLNWLKQAKGPVPISDIMQHQEFKWMAGYMPALLNKLTHRGCVKERLIEHASPYGKLGYTRAYEWAG